MNGRDNVARVNRSEWKGSEWLRRDEELGGRYRVEKHLAAGSFGAVFSAYDLKTPGRRVALKLMPEYHEVLQEIVALTAIRHPNVVSVVDHGTLGGAPYRPVSTGGYLVMEWIEGETLAVHIDQRRSAEGE